MFEPECFAIESKYVWKPIFRSATISSEFFHIVFSGKCAASSDGVRPSSPTKFLLETFSARDGRAERPDTLSERSGRETRGTSSSSGCRLAVAALGFALTVESLELRVAAVTLSSVTGGIHRGQQVEGVLQRVERVVAPEEPGVDLVDAREVYLGLGLCARRRRD